MNITALYNDVKNFLYKFFTGELDRERAEYMLQQAEGKFLGLDLDVVKHVTNGIKTLFTAISDSTIAYYSKAVINIILTIYGWIFSLLSNELVLYIVIISTLGYVLKKMLEPTVWVLTTLISPLTYILGGYWCQIYKPKNKF